MQYSFHRHFFFSLICNNVQASPFWSMSPMLDEDKPLVSMETKLSMFVCLCVLMLQKAVTENGHQSRRKHICHGRLLPWRHHCPKISGSSPSHDSSKDCQLRGPYNAVVIPQTRYREISICTTCLLAFGEDVNILFSNRINFIYSISDIVRSTATDDGLRISIQNRNLPNADNHANAIILKSAMEIKVHEFKQKYSVYIQERPVKLNMVRKFSKGVADAEKGIIMSHTHFKLLQKQSRASFKQT